MSCRSDIGFKQSFIAQFFREALPLRLILLMIACQKAGGQIP
ncbi:hypothetical protein PV379_24370 [Streptomyces caniscabiei]|nr:hypothetical protein [Streptomyces caniscabiei]MDX2606544.1 hypothetical protein [Streptomyces caniscabiei]MDX2741727.1 hypothetical protein [Streptomyces caniscabiei]MDX2780428.1 hypothetical protein [Streptomyces caniscabiei]